MTREEAISILQDIRYDANTMINGESFRGKACMIGIEALEQQSCEMTAEEYRQRLIQAFHNADTDELIAVCVLPTEQEFEHLEWLLKNHYKKEPCEDCISRQEVLDVLQDKWNMFSDANDAIQESIDTIEALPPVTPQPKTGRWIPVTERLPRVSGNYLIAIADSNYKNGQYYEISWFYPSNKEWSYRNAAVIAWMPLPEKYKEAEDE